jgi:hypothetical protein
MPSCRKPCIFDTGSAGSIYIGPNYGSTVTFDTSASVGYLNMQVSGPTPSSVAISSGKTLTVQGGQMSGGSIGGAGTLTFAGGGSFSFFSNAGVSPATWNIESGFTVNDSAYLTVGATVWQRGTFNWQLNDILLNGTFNNLGSFTTTTNQKIDGPGSFENNGFFCKDFSNGTTTLAATFNGLAASDIKVKGGAVSQQNTGTDIGKIDVSAGAEYKWEGGITRTLTGILSLSGAGTVKVLDAEIKVPAGCRLDSAVATLGLGDDDAVLSGGGTASISGLLDWSAGTIQDFGANKLITSGRVDISTGSDKNLISVVQMSLTNATNWTGGDIVVTDSSIENTGTFTINNTIAEMRTEGDTGSFRNKDGGTVTNNGMGFTTFAISFNNRGNLLVNGTFLTFGRGLTQEGNGLTDLGDSGSLTVSGAQSKFNLAGGVLRGSGSITGELWNSGGEVRIEKNQTIGVIGNYTQTAAGKLSFKRDAAGWGAFNVRDTATLAGSLLLDNAGFAVPPGQTVMTAGTLVGTFDAVPGYTVTYFYAGAPNRVSVTQLP